VSKHFFANAMHLTREETQIQTGVILWSTMIHVSTGVAHFHIISSLHHYITLLQNTFTTIKAFRCWHISCPCRCKVWKEF